MEVFNDMLLGFAVALTPTNLFWCFVGVFLGTIVGILPGLGTPATIAILPPLTFQMSPTTGLIMMAGAVRSLPQSLIDQTRHLALADGAISPAEQAQIDEFEDLKRRGTIYPYPEPVVLWADLAFPTPSGKIEIASDRAAADGAAAVVAS